MKATQTVTLPALVSRSSSSQSNHDESKRRTFHIKPFFDTITNVYEEDSSLPTRTTQSTSPRKASPKRIISQPSYVVTHTPTPAHKRSHFFHSRKDEPQCEIEVVPQTYPANSVSSCCRVYPTDPKSSSISLYTQSTEDNKEFDWPEEPIRHEWAHNTVAEAVSNLMDARRALVSRGMAWSELWHEGTRVLELRDATARREKDEVVARAAFARDLADRTGTVEVYDRFEDEVDAQIFVADVLVSLMGEVEARKMRSEESEEELPMQRMASVQSKSSRSSKCEGRHGLFSWGRDARGRHRSPSGALAGAVTGTALAGTGLTVR